MNNIFILLLGFLSLNAYSQETTRIQPGPTSGKLSLVIHFSPAYCYRTLVNEDGSDIIDKLKSLRNDHEIGKFGYSAGIAASYKMNKQFSLEAGIQYLNPGFKTKMTDLNFNEPEPAFPDKFRTTSSFHYIGIPVKVNYISGDGKLEFIAGLGFSANILLKACQKTTLQLTDHTEKKTITTTDEYKKLDFVPMASVGVQYRINGRMILRAEPTFSYGLLKISDTPLSAHLYSAGLNISYYLTL